MSSPYYSRRIGRAASPPTWAWYEQIPYHDDCSDTSSDSCSEDEDDYSGAVLEDRFSSDSEDKDANRDDELNMDMSEEGDGSSAKDTEDTKGKQRAMDLDSGKPRKERLRRKHRQPGPTLRPILTIQKSQGFVWNQELFVPPYIKDRYVASTSPPNSRGFISTSFASTNSNMTDYEVEVVEIRVNEGDLSNIMP